MNRVLLTGKTLMLKMSREERDREVEVINKRRDYAEFVATGCVSYAKSCTVDGPRTRS